MLLSFSRADKESGAPAQLQRQLDKTVDYLTLPHFISLRLTNLSQIITPSPNTPQPG
jgi:hypothetical protein